jgi:hypothetical protein
VGGSDEFNVDFNPVVDAATGTVAYSPYRRHGKYRTLAAAATSDFIFNLAKHAENFYAISAGISFSATTAYDKGTIRKKLQTIAGTDITAQYQEDEIDLDDPITDWKEVLLMEDTWDDFFLPSHIVSDDASLGNINQIIQIIAHASLAAVTLWIDHIAIVPTDRWVRVDTINSNCLIIDSTMGEVFDSTDGSPSNAMTHNPTLVEGTPRFRLDPAGSNFTVIAINKVIDDMRVSLVNVVMRYRPRTKLHF